MMTCFSWFCNQEATYQQLEARGLFAKDFGFFCEKHRNPNVRSEKMSQRLRAWNDPRGQIDVMKSGFWNEF